MSINYTQLFTRLGPIVGQINTWLTEQATLLGTGGGSITTGSLNIIANYSARPDLVVGLEQFFQGNASNVSSWCSQLKTYADNTISDLQVSLSSPSASTSTILPLMINDMVANSQTVQKNTVSAVSITTGSNVGTGTLLASIASVPGVVNTNDERILNESVKFTCIRDAFSGATAGSESFSIVGDPNNSPYTNLTQGNGSGPSITVGGQNILTNGSFASYSSGNFNGWTAASGGPQITQNTTTVQAGSGAAQFMSEGGSGTSTLTLTQSVSSQLKASTCYAFGIWLRTVGSPSGGTFTVTLSGTGMSTVTLFSANPNTLTTNYALKQTFFNTPASFSNPVVTISWVSSGSAASGSIVLADNIVLNTPVNFGNVQYALYRGSTDYLRGDTITAVTANNDAGLFQTFFGRFYDVALPSSASPSISDSLVT